MNSQQLYETIGIAPVNESTLEGLRLLRNEASIRSQFIDSSEVSRRRHSRWFKSQVQDPTQITWVAIDELHRVVGAVALVGINTETKSCEFGRLMASNLIPRPRGLGRFLTNFAMQEARTLSMEEIHLNVIETNLRALMLYATAGFKITKRRGNLIHMRLKLEDLADGWERYKEAQTSRQVQSTAHEGLIY